MSSILQTVDPELMVHPLRLERTEDDIRSIFGRIDRDDDTLTLEEVDAAMDWLYDYIAGQQQTVYGTTVLQ